MKKLIFLILSFWCYNSAYAYRFIFDGMADQKYPVVMEVDRNANGSIFGRYAYKSTLKNQGEDKASSWLYINPVNDSTSEYVINDSEGEVQEVWEMATFWRNGNVNLMNVWVTNCKGKSFIITFRSASKNISTWSGVYSIYNAGYRSISPSTTRIVLSYDGANTYKGMLTMKLTDRPNEDEGGMLYGDIVGTVNENVMTLRMVSCHTVAGEYDYFGYQDEKISSGSIIARITYDGGTSFSIQPEGQMTNYICDMRIIPTIVKIE